MKKWLRKVQDRVYFIPVSYAALGFVLALVFIYVDIAQADRLQFLPGFMFTEVSLAESIFSSLVGALLTMITVSFSTIMVVLTLYSGQFTPRITRDFLERRVPLRILGAFMATFIFCIVSLYALGAAEHDQLLLSPAVGVILAIGCLGLFGYFIHHVARSVQINYIIDRVSRDIMSSVEKHIEQIEASPFIRRHLEDVPEGISEEALTEVTIDAPGFVQDIDYDALVAVATEYNLVLYSRTRLGEYLEEDDVVVSVHSYSNRESPDGDELADTIRATISCGEERNTRQDVEFGIIKLVEIALRAVSPGINDPNTAIYCISKLGPILRTIGRELEILYYYDEDMVFRLQLQNLLFRELVYETYYQIRHYGRHDVSVLGALLDSVGDIADSDNGLATDHLWSLAEYLLEDLPPDTFAGMDVSFLNSKIRGLARLLSTDPTDLLIESG